jgi:hypothetical protein
MRCGMPAYYALRELLRELKLTMIISGMRTDTFWTAVQQTSGQRTFGPLDL